MIRFHIFLPQKPRLSQECPAPPPRGPSELESGPFAVRELIMLDEARATAGLSQPLPRRFCNFRTRDPRLFGGGSQAARARPDRFALGNPAFPPKLALGRPSRGSRRLLENLSFSYGTRKLLRRDKFATAANPGSAGLPPARPTHGCAPPDAAPKPGGGEHLQEPGLVVRRLLQGITRE